MVENLCNPTEILVPQWGSLWRPENSDSKGRWFESSRAYQNVLMKDSARKTPHESAVFSHIYRLFPRQKVRETAFSWKTVLPRERRHFEDAPNRFPSSKWLEHKACKNKENHDKPSFSSLYRGRAAAFFVLRHHWCFCLVCPSFLGGVGNSYPRAFRVYLGYNQTKENKHDRHQKLMRSDPHRPAWAGQRRTGTTGANHQRVHH